MNFVSFEPEEVPVAMKVPRETHPPVAHGDHGAWPSFEAAPKATPFEVRGASRGPSDESEPAPAGESSMDCFIVHDKLQPKQFLNLHGQRRAVRQAARARYEDMISLVSSLGHGGKSYRREASQRLRAIVAEGRPRES